MDKNGKKIGIDKRFLDLDQKIESYRALIKTLKERGTSPAKPGIEPHGSLGL